MGCRIIRIEVQGGLRSQPGPFQQASVVESHR